MLSPRLAAWLLALCAAPLLLVAYQATAPGEFAPLSRLAGTLLPAYLGNSVLLAAAAASVALLIGVGGAFAVVFHAFPGRRLFDLALVLPLVLPPYLVAIVYRELSHRLGWAPLVETPLGAAAVLALTLYPLVYLLVRTAFAREAAAFVETGLALGLGRRRIAARALLPLATPAALLGALLVVIETLSDYGTAAALGVHTLTTAVHRLWFAVFDATLAVQVALLATLLPLVLVAAYASTTRGRGFAGPPNRPRTPPRTPLSGASRWAVPALLALPLLAGFVVPVAVLLDWAAAAFARVNLGSLYADLADTLALAVGTALGTLLLGTWFALVGRASGSRRWGLAVLGVTSMNYAMPAIVLAIALLVLSGWSYATGAGAWFANSLLLVVLATTLRFTGLAYFSVASGLQAVTPRVDEAVRCAGRSRAYGIVHALLPQLRAPLLVGTLLVFVVTAKELTLPLVLQPFGFRPLPLSVFYFADVDSYGPAAIYALCLVLVVLYPVLSLNRWLGSR